MEETDDFILTAKGNRVSSNKTRIKTCRTLQRV